jgi:nucleoside-diphosphate-sugar epimerase
VTKLAAEQLAMSYFRESGLPVSVLRFFSVYGERERPEKLYHKLIRAIYNNEDFTIYEGARDHIRSYTYISDIIDGCILVMENFEKAKGEIFNLGNDQTMTTGEGIDIIQNLIGKSARFVNLPKRVGDQKETAANIDKMRKLFGYSPKVKLEDGLARQVDWYKNKIYGKII